MRSYVVFALLIAMSAVLAFLLVTREPKPHQRSITVAAASTGEAKKPPATGATRAGPAGKTGKPGPAAGGKAVRKGTPKKAAASTERKKAKPPKPHMKRPLRVAGLGWELITPGIVANQGKTPGKESLFQKSNLTVHFAGYRSMKGIEAALARGGDDKNGADVAILPLPSLVASFERLRALKPQIFFVVAWSRGKDGLLARPRVSLRRPPPGAVKLVGKPGETSTFLSLFMLDLAGVPLSRVRLTPREKLRGRNPRVPFWAGTRPRSPGLLPAQYKFLVTTADAPRLIPMVAVAPQGFIKAHGKALTVWGQVWMEGIKRMQADVPGAARRVSKLKGAPHALDLLKRLGQLAPASLVDNARLVRLSGRDAVTLDALFARCWRIWRAVGVLSSPMPEVTPLSVITLSSVVRTFPSPVEVLPAPVSGKTAAKPPKGQFRTLLVHSPAMGRLDQRAAAGHIGFVAGVFRRSKLRISVRGNLGYGRKVVRATLSRFDLHRPERLSATARKAGKLVAVEVQTLQ